MIGFAYFSIIWLGVGLLTGIKFIFVDQGYDEEFKEIMNQETSAGMERDLANLFFKNKLNVIAFFMLIGLLSIVMRITKLFKRG
ncbi:hypothetical protein [Bacillus atrophaeus]|uniref:DUF4149 domain-containing protein n=1 Tax=Bacillus atrophaeus (strain 1942) TaxID=720555 RepID=A0ABM5LX78_BACA1|nr:hypothetical protein [Bacillus atrophaeus]AMR62658.1 hypothetical protein A1D11_09670 [Bacillus subtilis subsp. globigii]ADP32488.1 hypothetical protein BATR1942_07745 [Bacillus atrophaeus 1942]AIK48262.1 putative membrane protein [Bacillus atrophaeus subsp. globigii]EIM11714.1 hypothetical protein UY9_05617 [Bacillus atrophaeus C89]KFK82519.1 putative membrane protein [Bacillus atrophaeus]